MIYLPTPIVDNIVKHLRQYIRNLLIAKVGMPRNLHESAAIIEDSLLAQMQKAKMKGERESNKAKNGKKNKKVVEEAWSITICESGENHTGMQIIGEKADQGFTIEELKEANR